MLHFTRPPYREVVRCRRCSPVRARWGLGLGLGTAVAFPCPLTSSLSWWLRLGFPAVLLQPGRGKPAALENASYFETGVPPPLFVLPKRVCRRGPRATLLVVEGRRRPCALLMGSVGPARNEGRRRLGNLGASGWCWFPLPGFRRETALHRWSKGPLSCVAWGLVGGFVFVFALGVCVLGHVARSSFSVFLRHVSHLWHIGEEAASRRLG